MSFSDDSESLLFGVDYGGKVWSWTSSSSNKWTPLPNPTKVNIKRLSSFANILWGIGSDHQVYVYVPKRDILVRVREEIYENERWNPVEGFTDHLLPTDRPPFSNEAGTEGRERSNKLPSESWQWESDWQIENTFENQIVAEGWTYALDFPATYHPEKTFRSFVRRRKLFRYRKFVWVNRWNKIEPLHADHTEEPFIDVAVGGLGHASTIPTCCPWAISIIGKVYFRSNTSLTNPEGSAWENIPIQKGYEACQITVAKGGTPFVVTWTGGFIFRIGITPKNPRGTDWLESGGPPGGLMQLAVGINSIWAITRDRKCWSLKGNWPEVVEQMEPKFEWVEIPGKLKSIMIGKSDNIVLGLSDEEVSTLFVRTGITTEQKYGQSWKAMFENISWDSLSVITSASDDVPDAPYTSTESLVSLKPDIPLPDYGLTSSDTPNSFSWVDGACTSCIRMGTETDLEVGVWRESILQDLQKLKMENTSFPYPSAVDTSGMSWSKSTRVKFLNMSRNRKWVDGQLEISNNNHLMFHESLEKTWLCSVLDVLSIFEGIMGLNTLTCRIRNQFESGVADFVNFQFSTEKEKDEWRATIAELATRPLEEFSISDIWLTIKDCEVHRGGQVRILDVPVEAEVLSKQDSSGSGDGLNYHHPLVRGFLPESEITIDMTVPEKANRFSINLSGQRDDMIAFHFNPRFPESHVIRNSCNNGDWEEEERDGVFPFRPGQGYTINIQCSATQIITTVLQKKIKFIFSFKHRIAPKYICNLCIYGDIDIKGVRYDPHLSDTYELEFVTESIPGHFWKVQTAADGSIWAVGCDLKVWCFSGAYKTRKGEGAFLGHVTDDQTYYVYENQRWNPITGFGVHTLPTDRHTWSDETGRIAMEKDEIKFPSSRWAWTSNWEIDYDNASGVDADGWQYAVDFPASYHPNKRISDLVRRRRWKRVAQHTVVGPWHNVPGMKLIDLSIRMNEECEWEVLGLGETGEPVVRTGITPEMPVGTAWQSLASEKSMVSISSWYGQRIWAIGKDGFSYIRYGSLWQMLDRPQDSALRSVEVGSSAVWAIGTNDALYRRTDIQPIFPEGREWTRVCEGISQVSVAPEGTLYGLLKSDDNSLAKRMGITQSSPGGLGWDIIAAGPFRQLSVRGSFSRNK